MNREVAASLDRLADALNEYNHRAAQRERAELARERRRQLAEGPPPERRAGVAYDALGRRVPGRLNALTFARAIPGYAAQFDKLVPPEFWAQVEEGVVEVACPCGEAHRVTLLEPAGGDCGRYFLYDGRDVRVAASQ